MQAGYMTSLLRKNQFTIQTILVAKAVLSMEGLKHILKNVLYNSAYQR